MLTHLQRAGLAAGLAAMRAGQFYAAHDEFEAVWRCTWGVHRPLFHGLALLAASYHQLTLGRGRASVRTWLKARGELAVAGALSPELVARVDALHVALGLSEQGPRFIDPGELASRYPFPVPEGELVND